MIVEDYEIREQDGRQRRRNKMDKTGKTERERDEGVKRRSEMSFIHIFVSQAGSDITSPCE
jgi:hypothetical protein